MAPLAGIACLWLLFQRLDAVDLPRVWEAVYALSVWQWALGAAATTGSLAAVGCYDVVIHRLLGTGVPKAAARRAGLVAIALSQTVGFGLVSGALVRWRMLSRLSLWQATRLTAIVAASFMAALGALTALTVLILRPGFLTSEAAIAGVVLVGLGVALLTAGRWGPALPKPNMIVVASLMFWVSVDTMLAALALYWLMPVGAEISFAFLFPAFLVALGVGMISGSPAGLGAFEVTLLALLPADVMADCLAATLAFRLVYYAAPAVLALIPLAIGSATRSDQRHPFTVRSAKKMPVSQNPEAEMLKLDGGFVLSGPAVAWGARQTSHTLTAFGMPLYGPSDKALFLLEDAATEAMCFPAIYKAPPRVAAVARRAGWHVTRIADEALLAPRRFMTSGSDRRQLRRALRKAKAAGFTVQLARGRLPEDALCAVHDNWQNVHDAERGFSMGRFDLPYLHGQRVYLGYLEGTLVAFISFHAQPDGWVLDLMRHSSAAPTGAMQALICAALEDAKAAGIPHLSLAAVPYRPENASGLEGIVRQQIEAASGAAGLRRFKESFAPRWEARYLVTWKKWHAILVSAEISQAIRNPSAQSPATVLSVAYKSTAQEDYENYEIDSCKEPCHTAETALRFASVRSSLHWIDP